MFSCCSVSVVWHECMCMCILCFFFFASENFKTILCLARVCRKNKIPLSTQHSFIWFFITVTNVFVVVFFRFCYWILREPIRMCFTTPASTQVILSVKNKSKSITSTVVRNENINEDYFCCCCFYFWRLSFYCSCCYCCCCCGFYFRVIKWYLCLRIVHKTKVLSLSLSLSPNQHTYTYTHTHS